MKKKRQAKKAKTDDLTRIEGIGPKTSEALKTAGVKTFGDLSKLSEREIQKILADAGPRLAGRDCSTWSEQAKLAKSEQWDKLQSLQDQLDGGRRVGEHEDDRETATPKISPVTADTDSTPSQRSRVYIESPRGRSAAHPYPVEKLSTGTEFLRECQERYSELDSEKQRAEAACKKFANEIKTEKYGKGLRCYPSYRQKLGRVVTPLQYVITVAVPYKVDEDRLEKSKLLKLPAEYGGIQVKVVECRPYLLDSSSPPDWVFPTDASAYVETEVLGGLACAADHDVENWGTLGICFTRAAGQFGVINAHFGRKNDAMIQPPILPSGFDVGQHEFGRVVESRFLHDVDGGGTIDAGIVELSLGDRAFSTSLIDDIHSNTSFTEDIFFAGERLQDFDRLRVFKVGARTNLTRGIISNPRFNGLEIDGEGLTEIIQFFNEDNRTIVDGGDSGSALVTTIDRGLLVVGIVFAGDEANPHIGYACHFADIVTEFSLQDINNLLPRHDWNLT